MRDARDGAEAVEACAAFAPQLVILDPRVAAVDGIGVARALRTSVATEGLVILAIGLPPQGGEALPDGIDGTLDPASRGRDLLEAIGRRLGVAYTYEAPRSLPAEAVHAAATSLPAEVLAELRRAVRTADVELLGELVRRLPVEHAALGRSLAEMAERYAYEEIEALLGGG